MLKESSFLTWLVFRCQFSQPCRSVESMLEVYKRSLILSNSFLQLKILLSWLKAADVFLVRQLSSLSMSPLLLMELPR